MKNRIGQIFAGLIVAGFVTHQWAVIAYVVAALAGLILIGIMTRNTWRQIRTIQPQQWKKFFKYSFWTLGTLGVISTVALVITILDAWLWVGFFCCASILIAGFRWIITSAVAEGVRQGRRG